MSTGQDRAPGNPASAALWMAGWAVAYLGAVLLSRLTYASDVPVALLWPAGGVALAWAVSGGMRRLPWVAVGVAAPMVLHGLTLPNQRLAVVCFAAAHASQAVVVGASWLWLRRRSSRPPWPEGTRGLVALTGCALVGATAVIPLVWWGTVLLYGEADHDVATAWVLRNTVSTLVVGMLLLELLRTRRTGDGPGAPPTRGDLAVLGLGLAAIAFLLRDASLAIAVPFAGMALLVWVGSRLTPLWAALMVCLLVGLATAAVVRGAPPFAAVDDPMHQAFAFQVFAGLAALTALALSQAGRERDRLNQALAHSHRSSSQRARLLQAVAGAMSERVRVHDERGRLVWANTDLAGPAASAASAASAESAGESAVFRALDGRALDEHEQPWARAFAGEAVAASRYLGQRPGGGVAVVEVDASLLPEDEGVGAERLVVVVVRDVTDQHWRVEELRAFAGAVAHDLRTPLTGVLGFVQMAQDEAAGLAREGVDVAPLSRMLDRSEGAGQRMERLIRDLLDLSTSDRTRLDLVPVDVAAMAGRVAAELREAHPRARIEVPAAPVEVAAEPRLLEQLLHNLVGNAVKYVVPGERPHVTVAWRAVGDRVLVSVADRGVGIPAGEEGLVLEPFRRASNHGEVAGSGLGLATCARTVERHGGRIAVGPQPSGRGTVVTFDLLAASGASDYVLSTNGARHAGASNPSV